MTHDHTFERKKQFYEKRSIIPGTRSSQGFRRQLPERQGVRFETVSGQTAENMRIHYGLAKPSDGEPIQFLKPLGIVSYLRSPGVREALGNYHNICNEISVEEILERGTLEQLEDALNRVKRACEADNPLHQKLQAQVELERSICSRLRKFQTAADNMANLISREVDQEQQDHIRRLYYASKIVENQKNMTTSEIYNEGDFSFIEKIFSVAQDVVKTRDDVLQEKTLVRLHVKRLYDIVDKKNQNAPLALKSAVDQILHLTGRIPVRYGLGGKSTTLMKRGKGPYLPQYSYGPEGPEEPGGTAKRHSYLVISANRLDETVDTAHGGFFHELTHAAVQRTFHNTPLHLGFAFSAEDDEEAIKGDFRSAYEYRSRTARELDRLIKREESNEATPFSKEQLTKLSHKLKYGAGEEFLFYHYLGVMEEIGAQDPREGLDAAKRALYRDIVTSYADEERQREPAEFKVGGSIFMEYDAVINQMLLWCYDWEIPQDNSLYTALADAVQVEVDRRERYRRATRRRTTRRRHHGTLPGANGLL